MFSGDTPGTRCLSQPLLGGPGKSPQDPSGRAALTILPPSVGLLPPPGHHTSPRPSWQGQLRWPGCYHHPHPLGNAQPSVPGGFSDSWAELEIYIRSRSQRVPRGKGESGGRNWRQSNEVEKWQSSRRQEAGRALVLVSIGFCAQQSFSWAGCVQGPAETEAAAGISPLCSALPILPGMASKVLRKHSRGSAAAMVKQNN